MSNTVSQAAAPPRPGRLSGFLGSVPHGVLGIVDQGIVSLANFAIPVLVGRYAGQQQLGYYTLALSVQVFAVALARSLVWTPYTKHCQTMEPQQRATYTGSVTIHLAVYALAVAMLILLVSLVIGSRGGEELAWLMAAASPAVAAVLLREHVRRLGMARLDFPRVLRFDLIVASLQIALLVLLTTYGTMTAAKALLCVAACSLVSLFWLFRHAGLLRIDWSRIMPDGKMNWALSKWLAAASTSATLGNQGYLWVLPVLTSLAELGRLGAAQVLVQFTNPIVIGTSNFIGPTTARVLADEGKLSLWRYTVRMSLAMLAGVVAFLGLVGCFGPAFLTALIGESAEGVTLALLLTLSAGVLSNALLIPIQAATVNMGNARLLYHTALVRLLINVTFGFALVGMFGAIAIGIGMLAGSLVALVWQWIHLAREVRHA